MTGIDFEIFDAEFATKQFSGNHALLTQILGKFVTQHQDFDSLISQHINQNNFEEAKHQVHTLKGVSGNLGMTAMYNACKVFEGHLANGQVSAEQLAPLLQTFNQTLVVVKDYSEKDNIPEKQEDVLVDSEKTALIAALKGNEFISDGKIQSYLQALNLAPDVHDQLQQAIHDLDYPKAIQLLE